MPPPVPSTTDYKNTKRTWRSGQKNTNERRPKRTNREHLTFMPSPFVLVGSQGSRRETANIVPRCKPSETVARVKILTYSHLFLHNYSLLFPVLPRARNFLSFLLNRIPVEGGIFFPTAVKDKINRYVLTTARASL